MYASNKMLQINLIHTSTTGRLGLWLFHFLNNMRHYVRISGGISQPVLGTVLGPLLFLIMIIDIDKGISPSSNLVSFADDTRVYSCINDIKRCNQLQIDIYIYIYITQLEKIQRSFTKHITGINDMPYHERLKSLGIYPLVEKKKMYLIIYIWTIIEA